VHRIEITSTNTGLLKRTLQKISDADPDPGYGALLTPGSGMGKKSGSGTGMDIPDHFSESLETVFRVKNI
jgi:hypothetical protein